MGSSTGTPNGNDCKHEIKEEIGHDPHGNRLVWFRCTTCANIISDVVIRTKAYDKLREDVIEGMKYVEPFVQFSVYPDEYNCCGCDNPNNAMIHLDDCPFEKLNKLLEALDAVKGGSDG